MCGRYTDTRRDKQFLVRMGIEQAEIDFVPRYNLSPTQEATIILHGESGPELKRARWGLIPSWAKDEKIGSSLINARSESLASKPAFRHAFKKGRCLVLADGFYEWQKIPGGKQPIYIRLKDGKQFAFAGLFERWPTGESKLLTFTIITVQPNALVAPVHDRMPLILPESVVATWLGPQTSADVLQTLLNPYAAEEMECYPVRPLVNSTRNEQPICIERFAPPPVPQQQLLL